VADRAVTVRLRADVSQYQRALATAAAETSAFGRNAGSASKEIDRMSGRLKLAADAALVLGPGLVAGSAAAVGGIVALSAQLGALAGGLGVTLLATKGLSDGLDALNKYQFDPTAANAKKLRHELELLGPSGQEFVFFLDSITPQLQELQFAARDGILPGAEEGIQHLLTMLPQLKSLVQSFSNTVGSLLADAGESLAGSDFQGFFDYLHNDGARILDQTARTIGNLTLAVVNLFTAFSPVSGDFAGGLLEFSEKLADASKTLDSNQGFQEFLDYIQSTGPQALSTVESLANALLQIVEAAAPLGGPVLMAVGKFADAIARIADSDIGTPLFAGLAALALLNRSLVLTEKLTASTFGGPAVAKMKGYVAGLTEVTTAQQRAQMSATELDAANAKTYGAFAKGAGQIALLGASLSGVADSAGLANTALLGLLGPMGAGIGLALDLKAAWDGLNDSINANEDALGSGDASLLEQRIAKVKAQLEDLQSTSTSEAFGKGVLSAFGGQIFADAQDEIGATTGKTKELKDQLADMEAELAGVRDGSIEAFNPVQNFGAALLKAAMAADDQAEALDAAVKAMHDMRMEALRAKNAELDYQAAIDDATKAVKENGKTHDKTTEKGRANLSALYNLAGAWNGQSEVIKGNSKALAAARENFIKVAGSMGISAAAARKLSRDLFDIPEKRQVKITAETDAAEARLRHIQSEVDNLRDGYVTVHVTRSGSTVKAAGGALTGGPGSADGGTVPKSGRGYADRYNYLLADGEEVISNRYGQADRHRSLLKAINAGRMADGGTAGRSGGHGASDAIQIWVDGTWSVAKALKALKAELDASKRSLENEKKRRDDLIQQSQDFASSVGGAYATADPFATVEGSVWGAAKSPLGSFDAAIASNTANTQAAQQALAAAAGKGLNGPLYQALAQSGNLQLLQAFAGLSAGDIDIREQQFASQSNAEGALGGQAASVVFGEQLRDANKHLDKLEKQVHNLTQAVKDADKNNQKGHKDNADKVTAGVNGAASNGHRRGQR
jgi:hypothetical protein